MREHRSCIKIGKDFMLSHGYIKNDFDVEKWADRNSWSRREGMARGGMGKRQVGASLPKGVRAPMPKACGSGSRAKAQTELCPQLE